MFRVKVSDPGVVTVYLVRAHNEETAAHEVQRFRAEDTPWELGDYSEYSDFIKLDWEDQFGIIGWSRYVTESAS